METVKKNYVNCHCLCHHYFHSRSQVHCSQIYLHLPNVFLYQETKPEKKEGKEKTPEGKETVIKTVTLF